jgi:UDP-2,3-diacylglucosamine pyrophosphatase LpxH
MARELFELLSTLTFKRLILLGDMFSDLDFSRLTKEHWAVISLIRKLSNPKRDVEVVWVEGNHDLGVAQVMEHFIGVKVFQQYTWDWNGRKCIAMHGHQFDGVYATGQPWFNGIITNIHLGLQKVGFLKRWLPKILDKFHTHYQRLTLKVAAGAISVAVKEGASYVFCGHTHQVHHETFCGVDYWNSGCWLCGQMSYITLSGDTVELLDFQAAK